jgi:hypothetical protein
MGGQGAPLTPEVTSVAVQPVTLQQESVAGMLTVIDHYTPHQTGAFLDYTGRELPW